MQQGNFDDFPVIRIDELPAVTNVYIVPPAHNRRGVGEPGVPPCGADQRDLRATASASAHSPDRHTEA